MSKGGPTTESLWTRFETLPEATDFRRLLKEASGEKVLILDQIVDAAHAFWIALLLREWRHQGPGTVWVLCRDQTQQERLATEIPAWWTGTILYFPRHEAIHFEGALPDPETASERLQVLHELSREETSSVRVVLLHHESLDEEVPAPESFDRLEKRLQKGDRADLTALAEELEEAGFERAPQVIERGQYALRGGLIDIFSWQAPEPVRIEFFDDEIESIRVFDIDTQTSVKQIERTSLLLKDAGEHFCQLRDYATKARAVVGVECAEQSALPLSVQITEFAISAASSPFWASMPGPVGDFDAGDFILKEARRNEFTQQLEAWARDGWLIRMYFNKRGEIDRFRELIDPSLLERTGFELVLGRLAKGFTVPKAKLAVLSDSEVFGRYQHARSQRLFQRVSRQRRIAGDSGFKELEEGQLVVHAEYGIGRYLGLETKEEEPMLVIEYDDEARLYVRLDQAHLVSRYVGVGKGAPKLSKLGGGRWQKTRKAAEKSIMDYAGQLLKVQAERQMYQGRAHQADTKWQWEFENAFLYTETRDQLKAIAESKQDMESDLPMDRLICGDVGFGKTEVAIRAAFKAVMSGFQVAILVPTTVLAQQHYDNFRERMSDYPIRVEHLTRLRKPSEQRNVIRDLISGDVDIVIGTHRLISKDISYKNLGLVVIDEEQRFGVKHKERFKEMFHLIDVLTLSATPIPRTLYLSLMGAKDMSTIETPPPNRLPVQTTICGYDERIVRDAVKREVERDGQVFYLHNRIESIHNVANKIAELCPGVRVGVGHGQMEEGMLEKVMHQFVAGEIDVLVCTTIIESGIDIPNANTIIIDRADRFGLADLYQLRGRVGRAQKKAYAILMLPRHVLSTGDARKRMQAIREYSSLGAGFKIAMRDLEIRGAGNLLGTQQSGHIMAVGFDLYCQLLKQSVASLQGRKTVIRVDVPLRIDFITQKETAAGDDPGSVPAFIPSDYIEEARLRILAYRQLAEITTKKEIKELRKSWRDRFGPLPEPLENLLLCTEIKVLAAHADINVVEIKDGKLMLTKGGQYLTISGKFPRLGAPSGRDQLMEAVQMLSSLDGSGSAKGKRISVEK